MIELTLKHQLRYNVSNGLTASEIGDALIAYDRIISRTPAALMHLFPGVSIAGARLEVETLQPGSLVEDFLVRLAFGNEAEMRRFVESVRRKTGVEGLMNRRPIVFFGSVVGVLLLLGGAWHYLSREPNPTHVTTIEGNNNVIIQAGADALQMDPNLFAGAIERSQKRKAALRDDASRVVRLAKQHGNAPIVLDDVEELTITEATVEAFPEVKDSEEPQERISRLRNVLVQIRATDRDKTTSGWACVVPDVSGRRAKLEINPQIDVNQLWSREELIGDIEVTFRVSANGDERVVLYYLIKIDEE